jgi:predicted  nucleic acid-binding Zn-ribbon protein
VNADPAAQLRLLDLQRVDTEMAQLRHRRSTLPQLAKIASITERTEALQLEALEARTAIADVDVEQRRMENEVDAVRTRAARDNQRLTAGGLAAKELEGLQHELTSLARRQSVLEDELLEIMEQHEAADGQLHSLDAELAGLGVELGDLESTRDTAFAEIDAAIDEHAVERAATAAQLPPDLLALYEKVAAAGGGVGAAVIKQRRCEGCHLDLAGNELVSVRAATPDTVVRCENCRRILIRTAESGL